MSSFIYIKYKNRRNFKIHLVSKKIHLLHFDKPIMFEGVWEKAELVKKILELYIWPCQTETLHLHFSWFLFHISFILVSFHVCSWMYTIFNIYISFNQLKELVTSEENAFYFLKCQLSRYKVSLQQWLIYIINSRRFFCDHFWVFSDKIYYLYYYNIYFITDIL